MRETKNEETDEESGGTVKVRRRDGKAFGKQKRCRNPSLTQSGSGRFFTGRRLSGFYGFGCQKSLTDTTPLTPQFR